MTASTARVAINQGPDAEKTQYIDAPDFRDIEARYRQNEVGFNRLTTQLELDSEITELYCDADQVIVTTLAETFYNGEKNPYTSKYERLCRFTRKLAAHRSTKGIRFPHWGFEEGSLYVTSFLEKTIDPPSVYTVCSLPLFEGESGACAIPIDDSWIATYEWRPFCLDYMKGELGCE